MKILGIDPGSHKIGVFVGEADEFVDGVRMRPLVWRTIDVGHFEPLPLAKQTARKKGRWLLDETDVRVALQELLTMILPLGVDVACIEWVVHAHFGEDSGGAVGSIATHVARSNFIGGVVAGALFAQGVEVHLVPHRTWQARVATASTQSGRRGVVADAIEAAFPVLVGNSNEHVRDAAGCALYLITPPPERAPRVRTRSLRASGNPLDIPLVEGPHPPTARQRREAERAIERAERERAGCTCTRRHVRTCPLFVRSTYQKGEQ